MEYRIKNQHLCDIIWNSDPQSKCNKVDLILDNINATSSLDESQLMVIRKKLVDSFMPLYNRKWKSVCRKKALFVQNHAAFLEAEFKVPFPCPPIQTKGLTNVLKRGRPRLSFEDGSEKTKKRRVQELASNYSKEELSKALSLIKNESDSESGTQFRKEDDDENKLQRILAMYVDLGLSKRKYEKLTKYNEEITGNDSYPPYLKISEAKKACYPGNGEHIETSNLGASVHFISLLGHTVKRILLQMEKDDLANLFGKKLVLFGKWGMDGASAHQMTRQKWSKKSDDVDANDESYNSDSESEENISYHKSLFTDKSFFLISFVPLQLKADDDIIWTNKTPSSVNFCRTIKFNFLKETDSLVKKEYNYHIKLLEKVRTYSIGVSGMSFDISFDLKCTMIDGKVCNILTGQKASSRCNICGVGSKHVNNLPYVAKIPCNEAHYKFGLSTLHAWIRVLEYLLHVSYNMDFKKFSARKKEEKEMKKSRKERIQIQLRSKLGLTVDVVKQGYGTTNTGNVARSFLGKAKSVAKITGLDQDLITRFYDILQVITCGRIVNCAKLKTYCLETADLCINLYPWYKMPPSVHKLLIHGSDIIQSFELPIGWYSEESQEGNNKIFRKVRANNSRMSDRQMTNLDVLHHLLLHSDPLISSYRKVESRKMKPLSEMAESMTISKE